MSGFDLLKFPRPVASTAFRAITGWFDDLSRRPRWCILVVGLATLAFRAALLPLHGVPLPVVHDEFSYLLSSDTFASGRLSNPMHPLAASFETIHILVRPKYASNYQPGQGLFLAFGQRFFGHPFYGVMISAALMNAAFCWMLFGWTNRKWALLVSLYPVLFFTANHYWMDSYWGGAVVALGAALVVGAYPRLVHHATLGTAVLFTLGLSFLFLTRPYEGGSLGLTLILLCVWQLRRRAMLKYLMRPVMIIPVLILVATGAFQLALNRSITGSFFILPYMLHLRTYEVAPIWWALKAAGPPHPGPPAEVFRRHLEEYDDYRRVHDGLPWSVFRVFWHVIRRISALCYPILLIPVLLPSIRKDRWLRTLLLLMLVCFTSLALEVWSMAHYTAPLLAVMLAFIGRGLWKTCRHLSPRPRMALTAAAALVLVGAPLGRHAYYLVRELTGREEPNEFAVARSGIENALIQSGERSVVFVQYKADHKVYREWVYNKADIDAAPVIWARDMGQKENDRVIAYYGKSRRYLLVEADAPVPQVKDYDARQPQH
jgi:hypothetical protein